METGKCTLDSGVKRNGQQIERKKRKEKKKLTQSSRVRLSFAVSQIEAVITSVKKKNLDTMQYAVLLCNAMEEGAQRNYLQAVSKVHIYKQQK